MSWRYNSGQGGYICDHCQKLLFTGIPDKDGRCDRRRFIYNTRREDLVELSNGEYEWYFCSTECYLKWREQYG